ncbi:MAG TPA: hypothetical protein VNW94_21835 [Streptosporangiaceae bacterium]|nr:hypothetical protein [Streptosporangiaceae bacterium]
MSDLDVGPWRQKMTARDTRPHQTGASALLIPGTALLVPASAFTAQAALVTGADPGGWSRGLIPAALVAVSVVLAGGASAEA